VRFLRDADVAALVTPEAAREAVRAAFAELAAGTAAVQRRERTAVGPTKLSTLGAVLGGAGVLGAKVYSTVGERFTFLVVLFAADDGRRLAVLESGALTRLRTAATSVVATEALRPGVPERLGVLGSGAQATGHVEAFAARWPGIEVTLTGRRPRVTAAEALRAATGTPVSAVSLAGAAPHVEAADVVVTATRSTTPVLAGALLRGGTHVNAVGSSRPEARELDVDVYRRAGVVAVEWAHQARGEAGGLLDAVAAGVLSWDDVHDLAPLVAGARPGPRPGAGADAVTVFQSVGIGLEDVAVAAAAYEASA